MDTIQTTTESWKRNCSENHFLLNSFVIGQNSPRFSRAIKVNERGTHTSALSWLDISLYLNFEAKSNSYKIVALWFWSFCQKWLIRCQKRTFTSTHMHSWIFRIVSQFLSSDVYLTFRRIEFSESLMNPNFLWIEHQIARNNETWNSWQEAWIGRIMSAWNSRIRPK